MPAGHNVPVTRHGEIHLQPRRQPVALSHEGGILEDPANEPEESMFQWTVSPQDAPDDAEDVKIDFEARHPCGREWRAACRRRRWSSC